MIRPGELELEEFKLKELRKKVDQLCELIKSGISCEEFFKKEKLIQEFCQRRYPDKMELYDMIYRARFKRLWAQFRNQEIGFEEKSKN